MPCETELEESVGVYLSLTHKVSWFYTVDIRDFVRFSYVKSRGFHMHGIFPILRKLLFTISCVSYSLYFISCFFDGCYLLHLQLSICFVAKDHFSQPCYHTRHIKKLKINTKQKKKINSRKMDRNFLCNWIQKTNLS